MSFILDALKKSDKKRQENNAPSLDTVHEPTSVTRPRRPFWIYLLVLILLLNVGLLLWFFAPGPRGIVVGLEQVAQKQTVVATPVPVSTPVVRSLAVSQSQTQRLSKTPTIRNSSPGVAAPVEPQPSASERIYAIAELPIALQRRLPEMHMSLHAYSKGSGTASLVRINEQIMREGARLADKYLLEEITADGATFRYDGYRFLLPRKRTGED